MVARQSPTQTISLSLPLWTNKQGALVYVGVCNQQAPACVSARVSRVDGIPDERKRKRKKERDVVWDRLGLATMRLL